MGQINIPYGRQDINQNDIDSVIEVLKSDFLTQGPVVPLFEESIEEYCNVEYAVSVNSATSALHLACLALGVGDGDIVWTSPITFVASANCALYCGAKIDFVDIDPRTYNISVKSLSEKLAVADLHGKLPKVVIPVHMCGQSSEMEEIFKLSRLYGFKIIEDASHAIGGKYKSEPIGGCRYSDITVFSFHPVKIITTAEGGMAVTNDDFLAKRMRLFRTHGITSDPKHMSEHGSDEIWNYQQIDLGFNYRMTELQAALGVSQMKRLDDFVQKRHRIADRYNEGLSHLPLTTPHQNQDCYSSYHLYPVRVCKNKQQKSQRQIYDFMRSAGVLVNLHYIPVYRQPFYESMGFKYGYCPEAEKYFQETISIPMYSMLKNDQQEQVIDILSKAFEN